MANQNNENASARELSVREFKTLENASLTAITLGIVGTAHKGPAFVPQTISTYEKDESPTGTLNTYEDTFGSLNSSKEPNPSQISSYEWFNQGGEQITRVRVLGMGLNGVANNEGIVVGSGFTVGGNVVSGSSILGALGSNSYASDNGNPGRTTFIGSTFENNQYVTEGNVNKISSFNDYLQQIGEESNVTQKEMITDVVMCPSGTQLFIESVQMSTGALSGVRNALYDNTYTVSNLSSEQTDVRNPRLLIRGLKNVDYNLINNCFFESDRHNLNKLSYTENLFNRESSHILQKGHFNYSSFYPQRNDLKISNTKSYFIVTGSNAANTPNYESFESAYKTAKTPWVVSQPVNREGLSGNRMNMHSKCTKLFRFYALDDGVIGNRYRIRITPQKLGNRKTRDWSKFTVKVWEYIVEKNVFQELLEYKDLDLNPDSPDYIGFVFGDKHEYYSISENKVITDGKYETRNNHLRIEINEDIEFMHVNSYEIMPSGFMPYPRLNTSGLGESVIQKPLDYVSNLMSSNVSDPTYENYTLTNSNRYWGVLFDETKSVIISDYNINGISFRMRLKGSIETGNQLRKKYYEYTKYFQNNYLDTTKNSWVEDLTENASDSTNSFFHLEKVLYDSSKTDRSKWKTAMYRRDGLAASSITSLGAASSSFKYVNIDDLLLSVSGEDSVNSSYLSFDFFTYGGFDGVNILDRDKSLMNQVAFVRELEGEDSNLTKSGATYFAYKLGHDIITSDGDVEIDILSFPQIGHNIFNKDVSVKAGEQGRYLSILNVPEFTGSGIVNDNIIKLNPESSDDADRRTEDALITDILDDGISTTISNVVGNYFNNKYTLNICNSLEAEAPSIGGESLKTVLLPSYIGIMACSKDLSRPLDSIVDFSESLIVVNKVYNTQFTDISNNSYSQIIKNSINSSANVNFIVPQINTSTLKLNSANTSLQDRNSLSRFAHNTRILIDIKKKIKYALFSADNDILFNNISSLDNVYIKLNVLLNSVLQDYVNRGIIQNFYVAIASGQSKLEKLDMLNNVLRSKVAISLFGKNDNNIEEFSLANVLNLAQNSLTEVNNQSIIEVSI